MYIVSQSSDPNPFLGTAGSKANIFIFFYYVGIIPVNCISFLYEEDILITLILILIIWQIVGDLSGLCCKLQWLSEGSGEEEGGLGKGGGHDASQFHKFSETIFSNMIVRARMPRNLEFGFIKDNMKLAKIAAENFMQRWTTGRPSKKIRISWLWHYIHTLLIYPSVHKQLIRTLF